MGSVVATGMQSCAPPSTNTAPSLSPQCFSHCLVMVSKVTLEQNRQLIRRAADKDEGRVVLRARLFASLLVAREDRGAKGEADAAAHLQPAGLCRAWGQQQSLPCTTAGFQSCSSALPVSSPKGKPACHCGLFHIPAWPCKCPWFSPHRQAGEPRWDPVLSPWFDTQSHTASCV